MHGKSPRARGRAGKNNGAGKTVDGAQFRNESERDVFAGRAWPITRDVQYRVSGRHQSHDGKSAGPVPSRYVTSFGLRQGGRIDMKIAGPVRLFLIACIA